MARFGEVHRAVKDQWLDFDPEEPEQAWVVAALIVFGPSAAA